MAWLSVSAIALAAAFALTGCGAPVKHRESQGGSPQSSVVNPQASDTSRQLASYPEEGR
jgi:hypothetical protein